MADKKWRKNLDLLVDKSLNDLIMETKEFEYAIKESKNKSKAQIWTALALINLKLNKILQEKKTYEKKLTQTEIEEIVSTLEKL